MENSEFSKIITEITEKYLDQELFIVDVVAKLAGDTSKITIIVDGDNGLPIDQLARINRKVGAELEEKELIEHAYRVEVTSPGVDMPLKLKRQYEKNKGRDVRVRLKDGSEISGNLVNVTDEQIEVKPFKKKDKKKKGKADYEQDTVSLAFDNIDKTNILVSFK